MKKDPHALQPPHGAGIGSYKSYSLGFFLCILLTLAAYFSVSFLSGAVLIAVVTTLGTLQIAVQLLLFVHLNAEKRPRWNTILFFLMILIVAIVVIGSLWIMASLNYRMME